MYVWSIPGWPRITVFKTSICWSLDWCESIKTGPHVRTSRAGIVLSTLRMIPAGSRWTLIGPTLAAKGSRGGSNCSENPWEQRSGNLILCQGHGKWFFSYLLLLHQRKVNDYNLVCCSNTFLEGFFRVYLRGIWESYLTMFFATFNSYNCQIQLLFLLNLTLLLAKFNSYFCQI